MEKLVLFFDTGERLVEYILPAYDNRKGELNLSKEIGIPLTYITFEVWDGIWKFSTNDYVRISQEHIIQYEKELIPGEVLKGKVFQSNKRFSITIQTLDTNYVSYEKYDIKNLGRIVIGHGNVCDIQLDAPYVSGEHIILQNNQGSWTVVNRGRNGTYLNQKRLEDSKKLETMDCISILGFKIYFLGNTIAINSQDKVKVRLAPINSEIIANQHIYEDQSRFSRAPRLMEPLDEESIEVEAPPAKTQKKKTPLLFVLGPSLTMPIPILTMVLFNVAVNSGSGVNPLTYMGMAISVCMFAVMGIVWSIMRNKYDAKIAEEVEEQRVEAYNQYISQNVNLIHQKQNINRGILERKYAPTQQIITRVPLDSKLLWNRNVNHSDFLCVRIGTGSIENPNTIKVPKERFSIEQDPLAKIPQQIYEKYNFLSPVAKTINLKENKIIGVIGETYRLQKIINNLIMQIAILHSYIDVRIALIEQSLGESYQLEWIKWLPHVYSDDKKMRYIANNEGSKQDILYALTQELRYRSEKIKESHSKVPLFKHYIVFSTNKSLFENENIYQYMIDDVDYQFTFILLHGTPDELPNECKIILENTDACHGVYRLDKTFIESNRIKFEKIDYPVAEEFSRKISGLYVNELNEGGIPERVDYFEMLGIGRIEQWNLIQHYKENRSYEGIRSWIGIGAGEHPVYLDIHEKKHGPHGLVAGTTGSGKSELIQTFVLSLALNYHPDEVAFILIDYKGGGMANTFLGLPHLAGTITNLGNGNNEESTEMESIDDNQTRRALISIRSEIKRRQRIFNKYKVSHIDLYMRLYRENKANEPMPHLIIISDEFAELKKEQPEFIRELVSTARVGRSLGIHLILATQKPGGVVDDEIWANSRFKLCLRVQDKQDSMGMLKRPEASELTLTGRAYMQIGNDELFEQFQSAYSGADYQPKDDSDAWDDDDVTMIRLDGSEAIVKVKEKNTDDHAQSQLSICVQYIHQMAKQYRINDTMPLWLPALPTLLNLNDLEKKYTINYNEGIIAVIGLVDHPEKQSQYPLSIDLCRTNNILIVGRAGCGKTVLLQTLTFSLMRHYTPEDVQFYCADFSSRSFSVFNCMPHFGGVVFSDDAEKIERMIRLLSEEVDGRKMLFSKEGNSDFFEYRKLKKKLPLIVVIIDNFIELTEIYPEYEEIWQKLFREGCKYGIQFIVSINHLNDIRYKLKQNFSETIPLQLNEKTDYMEVFGRTPPILPSNNIGRGLVINDTALEFQTAVSIKGKNNLERRNNMLEIFNAFLERYTGVHARPIPVIPKNLVYEELYDLSDMRTRSEIIPMGYYCENIEPYGINLRQTYCHGVGGTRNTAIEAYLNQILYAGTEGETEVHLIHVNMDMNKLYINEKTQVYHDYETIRELLIYLKDIFKTRSDQIKEHQKTHVNESIYDFCKDNFKDVFIVIDDMGAFEKIVYQTNNRESLRAIVELFIQEGKGRGVYFFAGFPALMESSMFFMQTAKLFNNYNSAVHFGGQLDKQRLISTTLPLRKQTEVTPFNYGYAMNGGIVNEIWIPETLIKV